MAGIYIHIPYCLKKCAYCNFYSCVNSNVPEIFINSLIKELKNKQFYLSGETVSSIYFGGGTPSLLTSEQICKILSNIKENHNITGNIEITLEANPENIKEEYLEDIYNQGVNRISTGIQSLYNTDLNYLERIHSAEKSKIVLDLLNKSPFNNISIDLIYGIPTLSDKNWEENIDIITGRSIPHISAYALTVEESTLLHQQIISGEKERPDDKTAIQHYDILTEKLKKAGYEHYEISNFCKPNCESKHNSAYWEQQKYLGVGPSAHSYDHNSRSQNTDDTYKYINALNSGQNTYYTTEILSTENKFNEYIMTRLRTSKGINISQLQTEFNENLVGHFIKTIDKYIKNGKIEISDNNYILTSKGKLFADGIAAELFVI